METVIAEGFAAIAAIVNAIEAAKADPTTAAAALAKITAAKAALAGEAPALAANDAAADKKLRDRFPSDETTPVPSGDE